MVFSGWLVLFYVLLLGVFFKGKPFCSHSTVTLGAAFWRNSCSIGALKSLWVFSSFLFDSLDFHEVFICGCFCPSLVCIFVIVAVSFHSQC